MEITLFVILAVLGVLAYVAGVLSRLPVVSYLGLGLLLIIASQNTIDGIYYRSGETQFTNAAGNITTTLYNYTNFNVTSIGASDWYVDATSSLLFAFALLSMAWHAFGQFTGANHDEP